MKNLLKLSFVALLVLGTLVLLPTPHSNAQTSSNVAWSGLFYASNNLTGTPVSASFPNGLAQNWGAGAPTDGSGNPITGIPADNWSARFSTTITLSAGLYEFIVTADDGAVLYINGERVIDDFNANGLTTNSTIVNISGGTYQLVVDYFDATDNAVLQVSWVVSTGTPQATGTAEPAALANVVRVRGLAVRTGPYLGASMVAVARPANDYPVLARNRQEGLFTWYLIQYDEDTVGWSSGRYLEFAGDPTQLPLIESTAFDTIYDPPGTVIGETRSVMNFRLRPSERVARVGLVPQLPWGAEVEILARTVQGGRDHWYQVRYTPPNSDISYVGWIYAPYVGIKGISDPIESVPII